MFFLHFRREITEKGLKLTKKGWKRLKKSILKNATHKGPILNYAQTFGSLWPPPFYNEKYLFCFPFVLLLSCGGPYLWRLLHLMCDAAASYWYFSGVSSFCNLFRMMCLVLTVYFFFGFFATLRCQTCWRSEIVFRHYFGSVK